MSWILKREAVLQLRTGRHFVIEVCISILIGGILGGMYTKPEIGNQIGKGGIYDEEPDTLFDEQQAFTFFRGEEEGILT